MRVGLRMVEERAVLTKKMAEQARRSGLRLSATSFEQRTTESRDQVKTLRDAVLETEERGREDSAA